MKYYLPLFALALLSCNGKSQEITTNTIKLKLKEASGVEFSSASDLVWVLEDSGNKNAIYGLNTDGKIKQTIEIENAKNIDWEDLASDTAGNLYIGDFGNNDNARKDLCIYKVDSKDLNNEKATSSEKISFYYPEQTEFPPKKSGLLYDAESFFEHNGNFYIFTKNRSKGFDGSVFLYKIPNRSGNHKAQLLGKFQACNIYKKCAITSADISPDGKTIAILSASRIYLLTTFSSDDFLSGKTEELLLPDVTQKEGICFKDNETLLIVDEKDKKTGGNLYEIKISDLKPKS
jgi:outer membrane protein assembly factor BamB